MHYVHLSVGSHLNLSPIVTRKFVILPNLILKFYEYPKNTLVADRIILDTLVLVLVVLRPHAGIDD